MKKKNKKLKFYIISALGLILLIVGVVLIFNKDKINLSNKNTKTELIEYKYTGDLKNNRLVVSDGSKYGYVDSSGKVIFPLENKLSDVVTDDYQLESYYFVDGISKYYKDGVYGIIDESGKVLVDARFGDVEIYSKDVIVVSESFGSYILDSNFSSYFDDTYLHIGVNKLDLNNFIVEKDNLKYGVINRKNEKVIDFKYDDISYLNSLDGKSFVYVMTANEKIEVYSMDLNKIEINNIKTIYWFENNLLCYLDSDDVVHVYNISDKKDETYDKKYNFVYHYADGLALVSNSDGKYGYIDSNKKEVIETKYTYSVSDFKNGYAVVCNADNSGIKCGVIDKSGKEIIGLKYEDIRILNNNDFMVKDEDSIYIIDAKGKKLTDEYSYIEYVDLENYFIVADKDNKYGILDKNYKVFEKLEYTNIKFSEKVFTLINDNGFYLLKV